MKRHIFPQYFQIITKTLDTCKHQMLADSLSAKHVVHAVQGSEPVGQPSRGGYRRDVGQEYVVAFRKFQTSAPLNGTRRMK